MKRIRNKITLIYKTLNKTKYERPYMRNDTKDVINLDTHQNNSRDTINIDKICFIKNSKNSLFNATKTWFFSKTKGNQ